jgi:hypothetical protein
MSSGLVPAIARTIAADAPDGWQRATLTATVGETWTYRSGPHYTPESDAPYQPGDDQHLHDQLTELHAELDAVDSLMLDLVVHADGRFEAVTSECPKQLDPGYLYVRDPYDLPAAPAESQPGPVRAVLAGDPQAAIELLHRYVGHAELILGRQPGELLAKLPDPVRADGGDLPPDLLALYSVVDGDGGAGIFDNHAWFGLRGTLEPSERWWGERDWLTTVQSSALLDCVPALTVRRAHDWPAWIPFATDYFGNFLAVDLDPGPLGSPGQVIRIGKEYQDGPVYLADSVTSLLRLHVEALDRGDYTESGGTIVVNWKVADSKDRRRLEVNGVAAPLRGVHEGIQDLHVKNAFQVDLEPIRGLPALWNLALTNCAAADLGPLQETPVEELSVGLDQIDLSPLRGHPTVRRLKLHTRRPVDLSVLTTLPELHSVDLSRAVIQDFSVLTRLPGLKYVGLRADQWPQVPPLPDVAAAGLLGDPTLADGVDWAARFSSEDPARHLGTY